jgi:hypothetical protein
MNDDLNADTLLALRQIRQQVIIMGKFELRATSTSLPVEQQMPSPASVGGLVSLITANAALDFDLILLLEAGGGPSNPRPSKRQLQSNSQTPATTHLSQENQGSDRHPIMLGFRYAPILGYR